MPVGALPLYVKSHSYGEYVFDHAWADALERAGGRYYPKAAERRTLHPGHGPARPGADAGVRAGLIKRGAPGRLRKTGASSWHVLFPGEAEQERQLGEAGLLQRQDIQFIFENEDYRAYADFLDALSSRKRKALRKERASAQAGRDRAADRRGSDGAHWDVFFACYQDTGARKWGTPYLNREFFQLLHERMADKVLMVMAKRDGRYIAAALNLIRIDTLFGRYWGCAGAAGLPAFRALLSPGDRFRTRTRASPGSKPAPRARTSSPAATGPRLVYSAHDIAHDGLRDAPSNS
jgi:predicted N-acyltransferase